MKVQLWDSSQDFTWLSAAGLQIPLWPKETAIGSLLRYLAETDPKVFHPMNVNLGIFPPSMLKSAQKACDVKRWENEPSAPWKNLIKTV